MFGQMNHPKIANLGKAEHNSDHTLVVAIGAWPSLALIWVGTLLLHRSALTGWPPKI